MPTMLLSSRTIDPVGDPVVRLRVGLVVRYMCAARAELSS